MRRHNDDNRYRVSPWANKKFLEKCRQQNIDPHLMVNLLVIDWTHGDRVTTITKKELIPPPTEKQLQKQQNDALISELLNTDGLFNWD